MSLRSKILFSVAIATLFCGTILYIAGTHVLLGGFENLESESIRVNVRRGEDAIAQDLVALGATCGDWAGWNDSRDFVLGVNPGFAEANLNPESMVTLRVNFMAFYSASRELLLVSCINLESGEVEPLREGLIEIFHGKPTLFDVDPDNRVQTGLLGTGEGIVLLAAAPISDSEKSRHFSGTLILGRYLGEAQLQQLQAQTHLTIRMLALSMPPAPSRSILTEENPAGSREIAIEKQAMDTITGFSTLRDIDGLPLAVMAIDTPRSIMRQGVVTMRAFGGLSLIVGLIVIIMLLFALELIVIRPVGELRNHLKRIQSDQDLSVRIQPRSADELGALATGFNDMVGSLQSAQEELGMANRRLVETARLAGMSEVASGVLHNVGNVLNSVNVGAASLRGLLTASKLPNLEKAMGLIREHEDGLAAFLSSDERGKKLPPYLIGLSRHLLEEHGDALKIADNLKNHIQHTIELISLQQEYTHAGSMIEPISFEEVIEDALNINSAALNRHGVEWIREIEALPPIPSDRHRVLQILVNLISNAKYAVSAAENPVKRVTVRLSQPDETRVCIEVRDTGIGIAPENLKTIFAFGFTTRKNGHGFGLHAAALTAKELGGSLYAQSDGPGLGAAFFLELPCRPKVSGT
ncbi:MAG: HAMP domain-containing protein [Candidatus Hydrogenedentes bacterium]|nr:HAMP domain-containing protein [Candidatus Hydrogenedentota bacterium]